MAEIPGLTLSKTAVSQSIDLEDILGVSFTGERALRQSIAQLVIDHMKARTQEKNVDVDGKAFAPYSKAYKDSTVFKLLKGADGDVNLTLTQNMIGDLDLLGETENTIRVGFSDAKEILKAYNHNTGDTVPKRQFFGVTKKEVQELVARNHQKDIIRLQRGEPGSTTVGDLLAEVGSATRVRNLLFRTVGEFFGGN